MICVMFRRDAIAILLAAIPGPDRAVVMLDIATKRVLRAHNERWIAPPGSTLKPLTYWLLMRAGKLDPLDRFPCAGRLTIAGRRFDCTHPPAGGSLNLTEALAYSCNSFAAHAASRFEPGELARGLAQFGIARTRPAGSREAIRLQALGEERVLATPLELAQAYLQIASGAPRPVLEGLRAAVEFGTAQHAAVEGRTVSGKTGSVRTSDGVRVAWFAGFTPSTVAVVMLQGRSGGADAAPVAAGLLREVAR